MKVKRENQRDEDATSVISSSDVKDKRSKPTTMNNDRGGILSFFPTKHISDRSKASTDQFIKIKQETGYESFNLSYFKCYLKCFLILI